MRFTMETTCCLKTPSPAQMQSLYQLYKTCQNFEPLSLSFPEDGDLFLFTSNDAIALSCLIVCKVQRDLWECYVFTHPDWRQKGYCRNLIEELCRLTPEDTELVFLSDRQSPHALAAFSALDMELWRTEYAMERPMDKPCLTSSSLTLLQEEIKEEEAEGKGWMFSAFTSANSVVKPNTFLGSCRILIHSPLRYYLYHVEIVEEFQNQGWGTQLINALLQTLPQSGTLSLHVSSDNKAALKLYKKTGFHITETLSYYLY